MLYNHNTTRTFTTTLTPNVGGINVCSDAFNAKELDEENNMYYYSARYYAPPTFISRDPMFEKYPTFSPYTYCANNPVRLVDPTGESMEEGDGDPPKNGQYSPSNTKSNTAIKVPYAIPNTETKAESKTQTTGSNTSSTLSPTTKQSVNNSSQSYAGGVSIEGTIAVGAVGYTIELGMVMDSKGEVMPFLSSGKASGYEASIGANGFIIPSKDFDVKDFVGKSMSINISAGDFSASYITDHSQGETKDYYQKNYYGLKVGVGAGIGASISHTKTEKVSLPAVPLDVLNRPGRR